MARIKINDLPKDQKVSKKEMARVIGGDWYSSYAMDYGQSAYAPPPLSSAEAGQAWLTTPAGQMWLA